MLSSVSNLVKVLTMPKNTLNAVLVFLGDKSLALNSVVNEKFVKLYAFKLAVTTQN